MLGVSGPAKRQERNREQSRWGAEHSLTLRQESADYPRHAHQQHVRGCAPGRGTGKLYL